MGSIFVMETGVWSLATRALALRYVSHLNFPRALILPLFGFSELARAGSLGSGTRL